MWDKVFYKDQTNSELGNSNHENEISDGSLSDELSLDYLPNELKYVQWYHCDEAD